MKLFLPVLLAAFALNGCTQGPKSAAGFRLPDGNTDFGEVAFERHNCAACHSLFGQIEAAQPQRELVVLGGPVTQVRTYGDLVTSIINPSHKISPKTPTSRLEEDGSSQMEKARLNDQLTVTELIDLVSFLQAQYHLTVPEVNPYTRIYP